MIQKEEEKKHQLEERGEKITATELFGALPTSMKHCKWHANELLVINLDKISIKNTSRNRFFLSHFLKKGFIGVLYVNHRVLYSTPKNLLC